MVHLLKVLFPSYSPKEAAELFGAAHRIASRYFGEGALRLLQPLPQRIARGVVAGDWEEVRRTAELAAPWATYPRVLQVSWVDGRVQISGTVQLSDVRPLSLLREPACCPRSQLTSRT